MDLKVVVTLSTLLLIAAGKTSFEPNMTVSTSLYKASTPSPTSLSPSAATPNPDSNTSIPAAALGLLTVTWHGTCKGDVNLSLIHRSISSISSLPVCHASGTHIRSLLSNVCKNQRGCADPLHLPEGRGTPKGYNITARGAEEHNGCLTLKVQCKDVDVDVGQGQLRAYKVVTALLCCVLLLLMLIRFTRPTVKALQKRFSEKRQNRWVGPTQSHSALERLAVSDSREPSSNRNSDYNL
ncbi:uncharacterized protein LOC117957514 isoform X2 [Etheostoma cragini]|uniref:uncharacterized protein LOC117957514 isoform X2 n=1 Tax=Etheostoma cragini TaxID=417921 RepID=UPI00155E3030|nr:uncharacterized protein LOC117957514 isoform X2 [Etheostoma cragini]